MRRASGRYLAGRPNCRMTPISATMSCSMSFFMAIRGAAPAPRTRRAGPGWSPGFCKPATTGPDEQRPSEMRGLMGVGPQAHQFGQGPHADLAHDVEAVD